MNAFYLNIVTALHCEAKPIIDFFKLKKITSTATPFPIYVNPEKTIHLIITGIGKMRSAAATAFLYTWSGSHSESCFINVGIAGSIHWGVGDAVLAHHILDESTQRSWYPFVSCHRYERQGRLTTVDQPKETYPLQGMVDMEASGFFQSALCFVSLEHIQVIKVISDQDVSTQQSINKAWVERLISNQLASITNIATYLCHLSQSESIYHIHPLSMDLFLTSWHFTETQRLQLKEMLRRWHIQLKMEDPYLYCQSEKSAACVIQKIIQRLDQYAHCLY